MHTDMITGTPTAYALISYNTAVGNALTLLFP